MAEQAGEGAVDDEGRTAGLIDVGRLARWMDERDLPGSGLPLQTRFISGGASNEIFAVRRGEHELVLRRPPRVVPKGRNETMLREYRVLAALNGTDVPHPEAVAACDDHSVIGSSFYLMGYVDGWSPMNTDGWPAPFAADLDARAGLAFELVDGIARLARVDWQARGLEGFGKPEGFHDRQVDRWLAHLGAFEFREIPGLQEAAAWLRTHKPSRWEPGIIHGDYQFANVMFGHGAPARLAAIVDWEMSTVGDPLLDLGWVVNGWPDPGEARDTSYVDYTGMPTRAEIMDCYATRSGRSVDEMDYYVILARFKLAIVLEGGYARVVAGTADNPKMEAFGDVVLQTMQRAAEFGILLAPAGPVTQAPERRREGGRPTFIENFAFHVTGADDVMTGEVSVTDEIRAVPGGQARVAALSTVADVIAGSLSSRAIQPRLTLTLDLTTEVVGDASGDTLAMAATVLRAGRSTVVTEVEFRTPSSGCLAAVSQLTFVPSPRPVDVLPPGLHPRASTGRFAEPWERQTGVRTLEPGSVEVDCSPAVVQLSGTLQGGMVILIAELAAESLAGAPVVGVQTRYLNSVRIGPARATARHLGAGVYRVEVRDAGNDGRLAALALLRTASR